MQSPPAKSNSTMTTPAVLTDALEQECLNCGTPLAGPYCAACGQKDPKPDVTLREFLHETTHELTDWDGKVPRTLKALIVHPGLLTTDYLAGRRARWMTPLRLYLLCSLVFFLSGPAVEFVTHRSAREPAKVTIKNSDGTTVLTPEIRREIAKGLPGRVFGVDRMERAAGHPEQLNKAIQSAYPKAMFVLLPLFAFLTSVAWRGKARSYPSHVNLALHLHAAWFLAISVVTIIAAFTESSAIQSLVAFAAFAWALTYSLLALRAVFGDSWPRTAAKVAAVAVIYLPSWLAASLAILGYAIVTM
jgi:hypothetical protein